MKNGMSKLVCLLGVALAAGPAMGAVITYDGDQATGNWSLNGNWVGGAAPVNNDDLVFAGVANPLRTTASNNILNLTIRSITFNTTLTSNMTLSGNAIRLTTGINNQNTTNTMSMSLGLTLTGAQTFSNAGTLNISSTVANGGNNLTVNGAGTTTMSGVISGTGQLIYSGTGVLNLNATNTYTGQTLINTGTVQLGSNTGLGSTAGSTIIASGATLNVNNRTVGAEPISVSGTGVGGLGAIVNNAVGTGTLGGPITMTGATTYGGTGNLTLSGVISGAFPVTKTGAGILTLGNAGNTFTGNILINQGTVAVSTDTRLGNAANDVIFGASGAGTLQTTANMTLGAGRVLDFSGGAGNLSVNTGTTLTLGTAGQLTGGNALSLAGPGTVRLSVANNAYSGAVNVNAGTLRMDNANSLGSASKGLITVNNTGRLQLAGAAATNFGNAAVVNSGGVITGTGRIGALTINTGGTLNPGALGTTTPFYQVGAMGAGNTVFSGAGNYNWQIYNATGAAGVGYDVLNVTGTLDVSAASAFKINAWSMSSATVSGNAINFNNASNYTWTLVTTTGGIVGFDPSLFQLYLSPNNGTAGFTNALGPSSYFQLAVSGTNLVLNYIAVPEPSTLLLLGLGAIAMIVVTVRRRRVLAKVRI
ncbi:MAG: autotransporter-associated beta strand repeat-containing protein [Planctomycetes bacterium]|nr:autotransporter-associated beta strand repeat-containing protein [Planctomycetota bacterium]